ncbi:hypothetical protein PtB15_6B566 [Puccinia triticina]|nr:hypothetical protein PtB15_6B566 [Puccinia triticina]
MPTGEASSQSTSQSSHLQGPYPPTSPPQSSLLPASSPLLALLPSSNLYCHPNNRLPTPTSSSFSHQPHQPAAPPKPSQLPQGQRTLHHHSSVPRFTQPRLTLRPRLNSSTTPLVISKKTYSPTPTPIHTSLARTPSTTSQPYFLPTATTTRAHSPDAASDRSLHSASTDSLPLSTDASSVSCSRKLPPVSSTLSLQSTPSTQPIHVIVRLRDQTKPNPTPHSELVSFDNESITLRIPVAMTANNQQVNSYEFKVDKVIYPTPNARLNEKVYERCSIEAKLLGPFLNGFNASLIAYGQTGSGKSFTLGSDNDPANHDGLIPKTLERLFVHLAQADRRDTRAELLASFVEIYNDEIVDLLLTPPPAPDAPAPSSSSKKVPIKITEDKHDGSIELVGCKKLPITDLKHALLLFNHGMAQRAVGTTQMNAASSRSHAIFTLHLVSDALSTSATVNHQLLTTDSHNIVKRTASKFQFVDLAGSERVNKTKNLLGGDRFKEGIFINAGLHSLGNVISALSNQPSSLDPSGGPGTASKKKKNHIPYRESKLTRLLKDCLGGNSKTILISCISQNAQDLNESLNTLRYAIRAKKIENVSQKTTKVISTPSALASGAGKPGGSRIPPPAGGRRPVPGSSSSSGSTRTVPSRAGTVVVGSGRREIKKPMVMMKHELSKIKALKAIVHTFFTLNNFPTVRLNGPLVRPLKIDAQLVSILQAHFLLDLPAPSALGLRQPLANRCSPRLLPPPPGAPSLVIDEHDQPALADPFLRFLLDLNAFFAAAGSPSSAGAQPLPTPSHPAFAFRHDPPAGLAPSHASGLPRPALLPPLRAAKSPRLTLF